VFNKLVRCGSLFLPVCFHRMLRRMKSEVLTDSIPTKKWVEVSCALTDSQRELYIDILERNYSKLNGAIKNGAWTTCPPFPFQLFLFVYSVFTCQC
jgi:hypothetical protein